MDIFNKQKIARLESEIARLGGENSELYEDKARLLTKVSDLELKVKCLQMWCDDDEAIDELMSAVRCKGEAQMEFNHRLSVATHQQAIGAQSGFGGCAGAAALGLGQLGLPVHTNRGDF